MGKAETRSFQPLLVNDLSGISSDKVHHLHVGFQQSPFFPLNGIIDYALLQVVIFLYCSINQCINHESRIKAA